MLFACNSIKQAQKITQKSSIGLYNDSKGFVERWKKKWDKNYSVDTRQEFEKQSVIVLKKQMETLNGFIADGDEKASKSQAVYTKSTLDYVRNKTKETDFLKTIPDLNDIYLERSENLAKISKADYYSKSSDYQKWQSKWSELCPENVNEQYKLDAFILQSNYIFNNQLNLIKKYINEGNENYCIDENNKLIDNYNFTRRKYSNYDKEFNKIENLNDDYLAKVPVLCKMRNAEIQKDNRRYSEWRNKWSEVVPYSVSEHYIKVEFLKQAKSLLNLEIIRLKDNINRADEKNTELTANELQINYDYIRQKYPNFDIECNDIPSLNDYFLQSALNLSKISTAKILIQKYEYQKWIDKWSEIGENINEQYLIDSFEVQSVLVFSVLFDDITTAKNAGDCYKWEQKSDLIVSLLNQTFIIYPTFDNFRQTQPKLANIKKDYLFRLNRDAKICIAETFLNDKNFEKWINKWIEIENSQFLTNYEIDVFNHQSENAFGVLLEDIKLEISKGNTSGTQILTNTALDLSQNKVLIVNPNFIPVQKDINELYLSNAKFFANAQSLFLNSKFKESIEYLLSNCGDKLSTVELKPTFLDFFVQNLSKLVEIYMTSVQIADFDKQVENLKLMTEIYSLKPEYLTVSYTPEYMNENKKYKPFKTWLDWRLSATLGSFFDQADSLINQNLYTLAYDFVFERANKIIFDEEGQEKINNYNNIFENQGTDYYKSQINKKINQNRYIIAKNILDYDLMKINPDFNIDRKNEYNQIFGDIQTKGTNFYIAQRDKMLKNQQWSEYCHNYCDSIEMINPTYNIKRCNDEITYEEKLYNAQNQLDNRNYFCSIDICNEILNLDIDDTRKSKARTLMADAKDNAVLTVNVSVTNSNLNDDLNSFINSELQDFKGRYTYKDYLEIKSGGNADYSVNLFIESYNYNAEWENSTTKNACIVHTQTVQRTRTVTIDVKKEVTIEGNAYFVVTSNGLTYYIKNVNGYYYYLTNTRALLPVTFNYDWVYEKQEKTETYNVIQYKYEQVSYKDKSGEENMSFSAKIELKENNGGYIKFSKSKSFSEKKNYTKYEKIGSYEINDLVQCPNATLNTWLDNSYSCGSFDESPFNNAADPFKGKDEYYNNYLKSELRNFIENQIPDMMEYVKEKHNKMKCD